MSKCLSISLVGAVLTVALCHSAVAIEGQGDAGSGARAVYTVQQSSVPVPVRTTYNESRPAPGGFIEFLFGGGAARQQGYEPAQRYELLPATRGRPMSPAEEQDYDERQREQAFAPGRQGFDPKFEKQLVDYSGEESSGTIVIDTPNKFLYLVQANGKALRYGIGVGRPGFTWAGVKQISAKREWPDWTPPVEMLKRRPDLPRHMAGGPENPLGARAMYLGSSLYRIHGSNEPWTIGTSVSSGCIRMRNEDVIDLYGRVNVGARVIVI